MSNLYISHDHLDAVITDYKEALQDYWEAKEHLGQVQYDRDATEAKLFADGLIYNPKQPEQGTNDTSRKLFARHALSGEDDAVQTATVMLQRAEAKYEVMRKELDAFRMHLQLQELILKERELQPMVVGVGAPIFFDELAPFDESAYERTLRAIREMIETEGATSDEEE